MRVSSLLLYTFPPWESFSTHAARNTRTLAGAVPTGCYGTRPSSLPGTYTRNPPDAYRKRAAAIAACKPAGRVAADTYHGMPQGPRPDNLSEVGYGIGS